MENTIEMTTFDRLDIDYISISFLMAFFSINYIFMPSAPDIIITLIMESILAILEFLLFILICWTAFPVLNE